MATIAKQKSAALYDLEPYWAAGVDPRTGLPVKMGGTAPNKNLKSDIKRGLRILDEQDAINRFTWYNLPPELNGNLIERILYYKGQAALVKLHDDKYYFLPFAGGGIDIYGRPTSVTPVAFNGTDSEGKEKPLIEGLKFFPRYDIQLPIDFIDKSPEELERYINESAFILRDYSQQHSQTILSRQVVNDGILDVMADCIPYLRTSLMNSTGVQGVRITSSDEASNIMAANIALNESALKGEAYVPIVGSIDFQELTSNNVANAEQFLMAMQSLDNYRLSLYGLENGGIFQKKSHMLEAEQEMNAGTVSLAMYDSLMIRQKWCDVVNSVTGWGIWCEPTEPSIGVDRNMDGEISSEQEVDNNDRI